MSVGRPVAGVEPAFHEALDALPPGYGEGRYEGRRWGATLDASADGRRRWLYAEALDGSDHVSFNLYRLKAGSVVKPCEMPLETVVAFVLGFEPDAKGAGPEEVAGNPTSSSSRGPLATGRDS